MFIVPSTPQDNEYLENNIVDYNAQHVPFTQQDPFINLGFVIRNDAGNIIGGITATVYCWKILYINVLWIDEHYRSRGYGTNYWHGWKMKHGPSAARWPILIP